MILICANSVNKRRMEKVKDLVELVSIDYAVQHRGGTIVDLGNADFSRCGGHEKVYIVGHGTVGGVVGKTDIDKLTAMLTHGETGLPKGRAAEIIFTSCNVGRTNRIFPLSGVTKIKNTLREQGYTSVRVQGSKGPSIKSSVTGDEFVVRNPQDRAVGPRIQKKLFKLLKPKEKLEKWLQTADGRNATIEEKAEFAATISQQFYVQYIAELKQHEGVTLDPRAGGRGQGSVRSERTGGVSPRIAALIKRFEG